MNGFRIAIIGSGPAGFYLADYLLRLATVPLYIEMFDRLPTPFGLIRSGVAPDHQQTKRVAEYYHKIAAHPRLRFFGNVTFDCDFGRTTLLNYYHQIIYAVGAPEPRKLGIPGESLQGSYSARDIVGWYNAHPDFRHLDLDCSHPRIIIIGNGNVALDIARILALPYSRLRRTDIADHALQSLSHRSFREIRLIGRKDPFHAAFSPEGLKTLLQLPQTLIEFEPSWEDFLNTGLPLTKEQKSYAQEILTWFCKKPARLKRRIVFQFLSEPVSLAGHNHVEGVYIRPFRCVAGKDGWHYAATEDIRFLESRIVIRANGFRGLPVQGLPFDESHGLIPNQKGRIMDPETGRVYPGEYVAGWIKRGPTGSLPQIRADAEETASVVLEDLQQGHFRQPVVRHFIPTSEWLYPLKKDFTVYEDWLHIDAIEKQKGAEHARPRVKFSSLEAMLSSLGCDAAV